ncbi:MAG: outer membrane protein assembly factor BamA, partial [Myxococcota bacterium]
MGAIRGDVARGARRQRALRVWRVASSLLAVMLSVLAPGLSMAQEPASAERPVVAVLPFRVHSADPAAALGESLAELLRSRLEAAGRVRVLPAEVSSSDPEAASGETRDTALRRLARSLGADFLITGSLTEIAGRFSLDVRVTPRDIGVESQTQVATAQGEEDLLARMDRVADLVDEQIAGAAIAWVVRVELRGAAGLEEVLGAKLETQVGEVFDPLALRTDVAALRAHPEVVSAKVESQHGPEGVGVRFDLVLADAGSGQQLPPDERIAFVEIRGNRRIESDAIRARIASRPGERFDPLRIAEDIEEIYALGFFRNVTVFTKIEAEGRVLIFEVDENPVIRQISISGNDAIDSDEIREILTLTTGSSLDYPLLFENRQRIEALYRAQGYYLAEADFEIDPLAESSVGVHFEVQEGEKQKLREIRFVGNEYFSDSELTAAFQTKTWRFWSYATAWFDRSGTYSEPLFMQDLRGVDEKYSNAGFLQAQVSDPDVQVEKDGVILVVDIVEGRQFRVGEIDVVGDSTVDVPVLRKQLRLQVGEVFNRSFLTSDIEVLTRHYQNRGFYFAQVNPLSNLSEVTDEVEVTFDVRKGPLYFIRQVDIGGNTITVDSVIRREIPMAEGELYSQRAVDLARARVD